MDAIVQLGHASIAYASTGLIIAGSLSGKGILLSLVVGIITFIAAEIIIKA